MQSVTISVIMHWFAALRSHRMFLISLAYTLLKGKTTASDHIV